MEKQYDVVESIRLLNEKLDAEEAEKVEVITNHFNETIENFDKDNDTIMKTLEEYSARGEDIVHNESLRNDIKVTTDSNIDSLLELIYYLGENNVDFTDELKNILANKLVLSACIEVCLENTEEYKDHE